MGQENFAFILIVGEKHKRALKKLHSKVLLGYPIIYSGEGVDLAQCIEQISAHVESAEWRIGLTICEGTHLMDIIGVLDTDSGSFTEATDLVSREELGSFVSTFLRRI